MHDIEKMKQRAYIENMLKDLNTEDIKKINDKINEFKLFMRTDDISLEIIGLLIFLESKNDIRR